MTTSKQSGLKRKIFRWTAPSGFAAIVLFTAIVVLLEYFIISFSMSLGLKDTHMLVWSVSSFTISISPLFHLLPLSVIIVLLASWISLTRHATYIPTKQPTKTTRPLPPRKKYEKQSLKILRRFINKLNKAIEGAGRKIKEKVSKTRFAKYLEQHIFGKAAVKSAWIIIVSFSVFVLIIFLIAFPRLIPNAVNRLFGGGDSGFLAFVSWTINVANMIGQTLSPLGWLAANINSGLVAVAPSFRNGVINLTTPIVEPLIKLDLAGKYILVQNVAAWFSALMALYFGRPSRPHR